MTLHRRIAFFWLALAGAPVAWAQDRPAPPPAAAAASAPAGEPAVQRLVNEDDNVRIEETRVRGQTRSITVHSKTPGARSYEILPPSAARDPSQPGTTAGQRVWTFSF